MPKIFFEFNGGLGNQIFQYLASRYFKKDLTIYLLNYFISDYLKLGYRKLEINKVLIQEVNIVNKNNLSFNKFIINKCLNKIKLLSIKNQFSLKNYLGCLNSITEKDLCNMNCKINSLDYLKELIKTINFSKNPTINISGYWQNPECYKNNIQSYQKEFKNTYDQKQYFLKIKTTYQYI